jgi:Holliday junction resolvase RusA-like endonuclease
MIIEFFVPGIPKTAGSKRAILNKHTGKIVVMDSCKESKDWKADIKAFAIKTELKKMLRGPLSLGLKFFLPRPKYHYGSSKNKDKIKDSEVNAMPTKRPDLLKMARAAEDALTGVAWQDDAQICSEQISKSYHDAPGVEIRIETLGKE